MNGSGGGDQRKQIREQFMQPKQASPIASPNMAMAGRPPLAQPAPPTSTFPLRGGAGSARPMLPKLTGEQ